MIRGEPREYGRCDFEVGPSLVEPKASIRGDIARTYLYMAWGYPDKVKLSDEERAQYEEWDQRDPITHQEVKRANIRNIGDVVMVFTRNQGSLFSSFICFSK